MTDKEKLKAIKEFVTKVTGLEQWTKDEILKIIDAAYEKKKPKKFVIDDLEYQYAYLLHHLIVKRKPNFRFPNLSEWATHIDKIHRIDKRSWAEVQDVIEWCQQNPFWQNNILSTAKLRKQLDRLELEMGADRGWRKKKRKIEVTQSTDRTVEKYVKDNE